MYTSYIVCNIKLKTDLAEVKFSIRGATNEPPWNVFSSLPSHFLFQVDGADIKYRSPGEEEVSPAPHAGSSRWNSFSMTSPASRNCSQNWHPSSPRNGERGIQGPGVEENHRGPSPRICPPSPFPSSPSFPSSPLASPFRLFEGAQRRQAQSCLPVSPALNRRGCSLTEASRGLR